MAYAPTNPIEVPLYQLEPLLTSAIPDYEFHTADDPTAPRIRCAQAFGSEIYVGCSNGELIRYALQADDPEFPETYKLLSRQTVAGARSIDQIVLAPSIFCALIFSNHQIHFYSLPTLDQLPIHAIRNVLTFAVDDEQLRRPQAEISDPSKLDPIDLVAVKRAGITLFSLSNSLTFHKEVPLRELPVAAGINLAKLSQRTLFLASDTYCVLNLDTSVAIPIMPVSQDPDTPSEKVNPSITVTGPNEALIVSWTGSGGMGLFLTGEGDPVIGTLQFAAQPEAVCLDYPYITALLPNETIEIHNIDSQTIVQVVPAPMNSPALDEADSDYRKERKGMAGAPSGYCVPGAQRNEKMKMTRVKLVRDGEGEGTKSPNTVGERTDD